MKASKLLICFLCFPFVLSGCAPNETTQEKALISRFFDIKLSTSDSIEVFEYSQENDRFWTRISIPENEISRFLGKHMEDDFFPWGSDLYYNLHILYDDPVSEAFTEDTVDYATSKFMGVRTRLDDGGEALGSRQTSIVVLKPVDGRVAIYLYAQLVSWDD